MAVITEASGSRRCCRRGADRRSSSTARASSTSPAAICCPGLIDSHQHLATPPNRRGGRGADAPRPLQRHHRDPDHGRRPALDRRARPRRARRRDRRAGPLFRRAGRRPAASSTIRAPARSAPAATPGETPWAQAIDERTDLPLAIARARGTGAAAIKIYANLPPDLVRRLTAEAHRQGLPVWAHGMVFPTPPADVIAAGPDVISHTCYLAYQAIEPPAAKLSGALPGRSARRSPAATIR